MTRAIGTSVADALALMRVHGRPRSRILLRWLKASDIRKNVEYVLDPSDHSLSVIDRFSAELEELRVVRNEAAHGLVSTKEPFRRVILTYYGSSKFLVPVGKFVISDRRVNPSPLMRYTVVVRTLVRELCKA